MPTTYPSCITDAQICNKCYASESCDTCYDGDGGNSCSAYCNSGCNTICVTAQTFCNLGVETVINHADISMFPAHCYVKDEFIFRNWRAAMWNDVLQWQTDASKLGKICKQSQSSGGIPGCVQKVTADPENHPHPAGSLVTAKAYNNMVARINYFRQSLGTVVGVADNGIGDVIRGTHAMAIFNGYNTMKFNTNVCDVCNVANQNRNSCNCSCDCSCDCTCDCACSCSCGGCSCSCGCSNSGMS